MNGREWMDRALCVDAGVEMQPSEATRAEVAEAVGVCTHCPVRDQCAVLALDQPDAYGVHAGTWWGEQPVWVVERVCAYEPCGQPFRTLEGKRAASYCSPGCRVAAWRDRGAVGKVSA